MSLQLSSEAEKLVQEKLRTGRYASAEEVVLASLGSLDQEERFGDFLPDEWNALLAQGERSILEKNAVDSAEVHAELRARFAKPAQ